MDPDRAGGPCLVSFNAVTISPAAGMETSNAKTKIARHPKASVRTPPKITAIIGAATIATVSVPMTEAERSGP